MKWEYDDEDKIIRLEFTFPFKVYSYKDTDEPDSYVEAVRWCILMLIYMEQQNMDGHLSSVMG